MTQKHSLPSTAPEKSSTAPSPDPGAVQVCRDDDRAGHGPRQDGDHVSRGMSPRASRRLKYRLGPARLLGNISRDRLTPIPVAEGDIARPVISLRPGVRPRNTGSQSALPAVP